MTWKENLWPAVCHKFGIDVSEQGSTTREYELTAHNDLLPDRVFHGEPHRLGTYEHQQP